VSEGFHEWSRATSPGRLQVQARLSAAEEDAMTRQWRLLLGVSVAMAGLAMVLRRGREVVSMEDAAIDRDSESSFPASDPPSWSPSARDARGGLARLAVKGLG
jgi:hypothetical protein